MNHQHNEPARTKPSRSPNGPPIHTPQYCVLYLKDGKEKRTAWMSRDRANEAALLMRAKYGDRNAIVYRD